MHRFLIITFLLCATAAVANEPPEMLISKKPAFAEKHPIWAKIGRVAEKTIYIAGSIAQCIAPFMGRGH